VKASRGKSVQQRICDLVAPGSHMAVHVLRFLYRLRYNEDIADTSEEAVERLRGLGPEVFLPEDTEGERQGRNVGIRQEQEVVICLSEPAIMRWRRTPDCK
jgi:hypothetical protein